MIRRAAATATATAVVLIAACGDVPPPVAPALPNEPPASAAALAVYQHPAIAAIQYTFFSDGTFELRYGQHGSYLGKYNGSETLLSLDFSSGVPHAWCKEAWCTTWLAMGRLRADTMRVEYDHATTWLLCNDMMDFEVCDKKGAFYVRVPR